MGDYLMAKLNTIDEKYVTGKGELTGFIGLIKPSTKFNPDGVYSADILITREEGEKLAALIKDVRTRQFKAYGKGTKVADITAVKPYETVDEETGEAIADAQGRYVIKARAKAYLNSDKGSFKLPVLNAKRQPVKNVSIGDGTTARLSLILSGYSVAGKTGVSVKLRGVQIIDLVEYSGGVAGDFDDEEGFDGVGEEFTEETSTPKTEENIEDEELDY